MNLTGRNLAIDLTGDDVMQLHSELRRLGQPIPDDELRQSSFGPSTREAVLAFQRAHGLPENGIVDSVTAAALTVAVAAQAARPAPSVTPQASAAPMTGQAAEGIAVPDPAGPTQPLPAGSVAVGPSVTGQPEPGGSSSVSGSGDGSPASTPPGAGSPLSGESAGVPPAASSPPAPPSGDNGAFVVQGHVRLADGSPLAGVTVQAVDKDLRTEQRLGRTVTDAGGGYSIRYTAAQFSRAEYDTADLIVRGFTAEGKLLAASPIIFNAPRIATVDLVVATDAEGVLSEYERYLNTLAPLLMDVAVHGVDRPTTVDRLAALTAEDLDFLTGETGIARERLEFLVAAAALQFRAARLPGVSAAHTTGLAPAFYGLAREGLGTDPAAMLKRGATAIRAALMRAITDNIIPRSLAGNIEPLMVAIQRLVVQAALESAPDGQRPLAALLSLSSLTADQQATLLGLYGSHQGTQDTIEGFWADVRKHPDFQAAGLVDDLQLTLKLNVVTLGHLPLVQALRQTYSITSLRDLVRLPRAQWAELLNKQVNGQAVGIPDGIPGASPQEQATNYIESIVRTLQLTFPTDAVAVTVAQAPTSGIDAGVRKNVLQFFANVPDFDLSSMRVDAYVQQKGTGVFQGIEASGRTPVMEQVKRLQRVYNVSPSTDAMAVLLAQGYDSAHSIASTPRSVFVQQMQQSLGGADIAEQVYDKSRVVHATMLHTVMTVYERLHSLLPPALGGGVASSGGSGGAQPNPSPNTPSLDLSKFPSLQELFGSLDYCDCEECRSVLSPAAYLVDLLEMLDISIPNKPKPIDVLFGRRPDLQHIPLTCENTNTPLPYIDLVNEILETWIATSNHDLSAAGNNDTGETTAAELRASPQYVLNTVYDTDPQASPRGQLASTIYPLTLPFDLPVETARVYLELMGSSLFSIMSAFQPPDASSAEQALRTQAECAEYLKITPEEYWLLTGQDFVGTSLATSYSLSDYYGYSPDGVVSTFLEHTGLSMAELIQLLGMRTVNPLAPSQQVLQIRLTQLLAQKPGVKAPNLSLVENCLINGTTAPSGVDKNDWSDVVNWVQNSAPPELTGWKQLAALRSGIVIAGDACDPANMYLEHQDGTALATWEWQWLYYFIRLWRKLGWAMADLDTALASWLVPDRSTATGATLATALPQLSVVAQLSARLKLSIADALALWVPFTSGTDGISPLYTKLFLNKAVQRMDLFFPPTWDNQIPDPAQSSQFPTISDHLPAMRAAFRVTEDDIQALVTFMNKSETDTLDLPTLSNLYRYVVLGRGLKLRIPDLLSLVTLCGGETAVFGEANQQNPASTLKFVESASTISRSGFSVPELDYLYRQITTPRTTFAPDPSAIGTTAQALRNALLQIPAETATDPSGAVLRTQMQSNFTSDQISQLLQILGGSDEYLIPLATTLAYDPATKTTSGQGLTVYSLTMTLPPALAFPRVGYVPQTTGASLYIHGALSEGDLLAATSFTASDPTYASAVVPALQVTQGPYQAPRAFLGQSQFLPLFNTGQPGSVQGAIDFIINQPHSPEEKFEFVLDRYRTALKRFAAVDQALSTALKLDLATTDALLQTVLNSSVMVNTPAMYDAVALATPGLKRVSTDTTSTGQNESVTTIDPVVAFDGTVVALPATTSTATWSGVILPSTDDEYTFFVRATPGVTVQLYVDTQPITSTTPAAINRQITGNQPGEVKSAQPSTLSAAQPCYIQLTVQAPSGGSLSIVELRWSGMNVAKATVPSASLYTTDVLAQFTPTYLRSSKAALLVTGFHLTSEELTYLWTHGTDFEGFDPNVLPLDRSNPAVDSNASVLFSSWLRLHAYAMLRDSLPTGGSTRLLDVFAASASMATTALSDAQAAFVALTGWDPNVLATLVTTFGLTANALQTEVWPMRIQACMQVIQRTGASPTQLFAWSKTAVQASVKSGGLNMTDADDIKKAAKTGYDDETWLTVAESLNDPLRQRQRDALVAYCLAILAQPAPAGIGAKTADDLFDYFLIDVEMEPCMLTSRIKQAIASVQTFVQRCLLNLEQPNVSPKAIDRDVWAWKSRNAVWQAAREVFLWPENYLVPELRDDTSPFFEDLESQLLQGEVSKDNVEAAFLNYLTQLDEVKQLDICGMYWQDTDPDTGDSVNILHVFGRTNDLPHVYYYRQWVGYNTWTPWEKLQVDIEGDHLIPVIWNRRLYLFWPIFTQNTKTDNTPDTGDNHPQANVYWNIKLAWSEYSQGKWQPKHVSAATLSHPNPGLGSDAPTPGYPDVVLPVRPKNPSSADAGKDYVDQQYDILNELWSQQSYTFKALVAANGALTIRVYQSAPDVQVETEPIPVNPKKSTYNLHSAASNLTHPQAIHDFTFTGSGSEVQTQGSPTCELQVEVYTSIDHMKFAQPGSGMDIYYLGTSNGQTIANSSEGKLVLNVGAFGGESTVNDFDKQVWFLLQAPSYKLLYPHQYLQFALQAPFFYQDQQRSYCVLPSPDTSIIDLLAQRDRIDIFFARSLDASPAPAQGAPVGGAAGGGDSALAPGTQRPDISGALSANMRIQIPEPVNSQLAFISHYHPYVAAFIKALNRSGVKVLLTPDMQGPYVSPSKGFDPEYNPVLANVDVSRTWESVDFGYRLGVGATPDYSGPPIEEYGTYSLYNWELFFHAPLLLAERLSQNQQFDEARTWFHYIFDPTDTALQYWRFLPFQNNTSAVDQNIQYLLDVLASPDSSLQQEKQAVIDQIAKWTLDPFEPHALARLRITAYQKNVVMKYLDNLIAWGDQLFQQDTLETINEATQLYILAARLLGPRPQKIPRHTQDVPQTYASLRGGLDAFANAIVAMENDFPFSLAPTPSQQPQGKAPNQPDESALLGLGKTLYFCIPPNSQLLGYWDTVADRLFKIRNCLNIQGVAQQLPLFDPPIDPMLLVQATAQGLSLSSVLGDLSAPMPYYRFAYLLPKALELCAQVQSLGAALLAAQEKADAEQLALTRASQETEMLRDYMHRIKQQQIADAQATLDALTKTQVTTQFRHDHYDNLITQGLSQREQEHLALSDQAAQSEHQSQMTELAAGYIAAIGDITTGASGMSSPVATFSIGGKMFAAVGQATARALASQAASFRSQAASAATMAGYDRREQDWELQRDLAAKELDQIQKQIDGATLRWQIANWELENHEKQTDNAAFVEGFLRTKYTSQQLYQWMHDQLSTVYYQAYSLAFDMAKKAERAYRFERGLVESNFVQYGTWNSQHDGLLAGEKLHLALQQLDQAYLNQNSRDYEITKSISLALLDPLALIQLKETGSCDVSLPEELFDADYPSHYMRRVKNVALTIPSVVGPYTSINCTLTLNANSTRINADAAGPDSAYARSTESDDDRFVDNFAATQSIVTSHAQNDTGLFELNFRDERYLPFEGAGVISRWRIELPRENNAFDFNTITDVILRLQYTARDGGKTLADAARASLQSDPVATSGARLFSAKHEFAASWIQFMNAADQTITPLQLDLSPERFPYQLRGKNVTITSIAIHLVLGENSSYQTDVPTLPVQLNVTPYNGNLVAVPLKQVHTIEASGVLEPLPFLSGGQTDTNGIGGQGAWQLMLHKQNNNILALPKTIVDLVIVCGYSIS